MKRRRILGIAIILLSSIGCAMVAGQTSYTESFNDETLWSGGAAGSYTFKTYNNPGVPNDDLFEADPAIRESSNALSGYAWRLQNSDNPIWKYVSWETISEFSVYLATWNVSSPLSVTIDYSLDGGITYSILDIFDETWWTAQGFGDKSYREYSSGILNISPITGSNLQIRIQTNGNERLLIDEFQLYYGTGSSGVEDPLSFIATATNTNQIELAFAPNNGNDDVVIAYNEDGVFDSPSGDPPSPGSPFAGGTLFYQGTSSPQQHSGLSPGQTVYYKAWSFDETEYSAGLIAQATTQEPNLIANVWINEFHYDNEGGDINEFVEIIVEDVTLAQLDELSISLYNGSSGGVYAETTADQMAVGNSINGFTCYTWVYSGIQNGSPEGIALALNGNLISGQFLSYEGTFTATEGPALGLVSEDIGVEEPTNNPVGYSLQLSGSGVLYSDFMWQFPASETPGDLNNGQEMGALTQWTGSINSNWHVPENWTNDVPTAEIDAWIPGPEETTQFPVISSFAEAENLIIETGAELAITPVGALTVPGVLTNQGALDILSDENGSGSLITPGNPTAHVQQYLSPEQWHYISSPVNPFLSDVFEGMYLMEWNEPEETWDFIEELGIPLNTGLAGYGVWTNTAEIVEFAGGVNNGSFSNPVWNTEGTTNPESDPSGYNLVGNPYPSALDWDVEDGSGWVRTSTNVSAAIYYWNGIQYASYVKGGPYPGPNGGTNVIPPHQGFFVKCLTSEGGSITVDGGAQIHGNQPFYKKPKNDNPFLRIRVTSDSLSDEFILHLQENASFSFDPAYDAGHLCGNSEVPQIYTLTPGGSKLSIQSISPVTESVVVPLGFVGGQGSVIHEISIQEIQGFEEIPVFLEDLKTQTILDFKHSGRYQFFGSEEMEENRFKVHLFYQDITENPALNENFHIQIFSSGSKIYLLSDEPVSGMYQLFDASGKQVENKSFAASTKKVFTASGHQGIYYARIMTRSGVWTGSVFLSGGLDTSW